MEKLEATRVRPTLNVKTDCSVAQGLREVLKGASWCKNVNNENLQ